MRRLSINDVIQKCILAGYVARPRSFSEGLSENIAICAVDDSSSASNALSFWIATVDDGWILGCWSMRFWMIPSESDVISVVLSYLASGVEFSQPPDEIIIKFGLTEIDYDDPRLSGDKLRK